MFVKVIAGVVAAALVSGVGIYIAFPEASACKSGCLLSRMETVPVVSDSHGCCMMREACVKPEAPTESLAACMGAIALAPTAQVKAAPHACCVEE